MNSNTSYITILGKERIFYYEFEKEDKILVNTHLLVCEEVINKLNKIPVEGEKKEKLII